MKKSNEKSPERRSHTDEETTQSQTHGSETQFSVETEETLEDEIEGEEFPDAVNPGDGRAPLRIEEECKNGRFKRVLFLSSNDI